MSEPQRGNLPEAAEGAGEPAGEARKPYRKPTFQFEQVFETMALQCGKIGATSFACKQSPSAS